VERRNEQYLDARSTAINSNGLVARERGNLTISVEETGLLRWIG